MQIITHILNSFSQIFFLENSLLGTFIILGIGIFSPILLIFALVGNITAYITTIFLPGAKEIIQSGLYGFNGIFIGCAMYYYVKNVPNALILTVILSVLAAVLYWVIYKNNIPPLAAPFVIVIWIFLLASKYFK